MKAKGILLLFTVLVVTLLGSCRKRDYYPSPENRLRRDWTLDRKSYSVYARDGSFIKRYEEFYERDSYYDFSSSRWNYDSYENYRGSRVSSGGYYSLINDYTLEMFYKGYDNVRFNIRELTTSSLVIATTFVDTDSGRTTDEVLYLFR